MLYSEIIAVCSQIHTKHINTLCGQNVEFFYVKTGGIYSNHWALKGLDWFCYRPIQYEFSPNKWDRVMRQTCIYFPSELFMFQTYTHLHKMQQIVVMWFNSSTKTKHHCYSPAEVYCCGLTELIAGTVINTLNSTLKLRLLVLLAQWSQRQFSTVYWHLDFCKCWHCLLQSGLVLHLTDNNLWLPDHGLPTVCV
jgi:hypothetical protein